MNERVKRVFEILGVEPGEVFKIDGNEGTYCIQESLKIDEFDSRIHDFVNTYSSNAMLLGLLNGSYKIKKLINLTEEERVICNAAIRAGYPWIARDADGHLNLYKVEPDRNAGEFSAPGGWINLKTPLFPNVFESITWVSSSVNVNDLLDGCLDA